MTIGQVLALVAVVVGFIAALVDEKLIMGALDWFVLAIALVLIAGPTVWPRPTR